MHTAAGPHSMHRRCVDPHMSPPTTTAAAAARLSAPVALICPTPSLFVSVRRAVRLRLHLEQPQHFSAVIFLSAEKVCSQVFNILHMTRLKQEEGRVYLL